MASHRSRFAICLAALSLVGGPALAQTPPAPGMGPPPGMAPPPGMSLTSPAFEDGGVIPDRYTRASAAPVSPALQWDKAPSATVSFTLLVHDPDVALQKKSDDVLHWMMFNIPPTVRSLREDYPSVERQPDGTVQIKNISGKVGYMGPGAPPGGPYHHYTFELFALDTKLDLGPDATRAQVMAAMEGHILAKAVDVGRFRRPSN